MASICAFDVLPMSFRVEKGEVGASGKDTVRRALLVLADTKKDAGLDLSVLVEANDIGVLICPLLVLTMTLVG